MLKEIAKNCNVRSTLSKQIQQSIITRYHSGETTTQLSKAFNCSKTRILRVLKAANVPTRSASDCRRKYKFSLTAFDVINEQSAYWLGFLLSDGNIYKNHLQLGIKSEDIDHLHKFLAFMSSDVPIYTREQIRKGTGHKSMISSIRITSKELCNKLKAFGIIPRKSKIATVPNILLYNIHFWRGMIDGDGSIYMQRKSFTLSLAGSQNVVNAFQQFLKAQGFIGYIHQYPTVFDIRIAGQVAKKLALLLYEPATVFLTRKQNLALAKNIHS